MDMSIQLILAVVVPTATLLILPAKDASVTLEMPGLTLKDLPLREAINQTDDFFKSVVSEGFLVLEEYGERVQIPYSSIWLQFDTTQIQWELEKSQYKNRFFEMIGKRPLQPGSASAQPYVNKALFREKLSPIQEICRIDAQNARLVLQQGGVSIIPETDGREFDADKAISYVLEQLKAEPTRGIILSEGTTPWLFTTIRPEITARTLQSYTQIYGQAQGTIPKGKAEALISLLQSIDNKMIGPGGSFSFRESISLFSETDPLQQLVASIIYQAILPVEELRVTDRKATNQPVSGIEPGLEVSLEKGGDLQFKNTSDMPLMLVFGLEQDEKLSVALAGKPGLTVGAIRTESVKIQPSVIYSQDNTLPKDTKKVTEPGKEGLSVKVYRVTEDGPVQLYEDVYQPVHKIIAVGTGIKKEDIVYK